MALTEEQAEFVTELQNLLSGLENSVSSAARAIIARKKEVTNKIESDEDAYSAAYGDGTDDATASYAINAKLSSIDSVLDALFKSGIITQSREHMEEITGPML